MRTPIVLTFVISSCVIPSGDECACVLEAQSGPIVLACGETACKDGRAYECTSTARAREVARCWRVEDGASPDERFEPYDAERIDEPSQCVGSYISCSSRDDRWSCVAVLGCNWYGSSDAGSCSGSAHQCENRGHEHCTHDSGCTWVSSVADMASTCEGVYDLGELGETTIGSELSSTNTYTGTDAFGNDSKFWWRPPSFGTWTLTARSDDFEAHLSILRTCGSEALRSGSSVQLRLDEIRPYLVVVQSQSEHGAGAFTLEIARVE